MKFRDRLQRFMYGRNGNDQFNNFLLIVVVVMLVINSFLPAGLKSLWWLLTLAVLGYMYFRMFSKNVYKRQDENGKYLRIRYKVFARLKTYKERWVQRKDYKFFHCPSCHATLRVPKGRGKIKIVCRKCGNTFTGKS